MPSAGVLSCRQSFMVSSGYHERYSLLSTCPFHLFRSTTSQIFSVGKTENTASTYESPMTLKSLPGRNTIGWTEARRTDFLSLLHPLAEPATAPHQQTPLRVKHIILIFIDDSNKVSNLSPWKMMSEMSFSWYLCCNLNHPVSLSPPQDILHRGEHYTLGSLICQLISMNGSWDWLCFLFQLSVSAVCVCICVCVFSKWQLDFFLSCQNEAYFYILLLLFAPNPAEGFCVGVRETDKLFKL